MSNAEILKKRVAARLSIPTLPRSVARLDEALGRSDVALREIGALLGEDPPLAAKVLRIANSSYYGLKTRVIALEHAAAVLGVSALRNMVMQTAVFETLGHLRGRAGDELRDLWRHSVSTAQLAESVARTVRHPELPPPEELYVAGLLHDIGRFALLDAAAFAYARVVGEARTSNRPLAQVERERLGLSHPEAGAMIGARWSLPESSVRAIAGHHDPLETLVRHPLLALIALCDEVSHELLDGRLAELERRAEPRLLQALGLQPARLAEIAAHIAQGLDEIQA